MTDDLADDLLGAARGALRSAFGVLQGQSPAGLIGVEELEVALGRIAMVGCGVRGAPPQALALDEHHQFAGNLVVLGKGQTAGGADDPRRGSGGELQHGGASGRGLDSDTSRDSPRKPPVNQINFVSYGPSRGVKGPENHRIISGDKSNSENLVARHMRHNLLYTCGDRSLAGARRSATRNRPVPRNDKAIGATKSLRQGRHNPSPGRKSRDHAPSHFPQSRQGRHNQPPPPFSSFPAGIKGTPYLT